MSKVEAEREQDSSPGSRRKVVGILVVDDDPDILSSLGDLLDEVAGCQVLGRAKSGEEAIQLVDSLRPDVVLMDLRMPGIDGIEATRRIAVDHPETAVVMHSAYGDEPLVAEALVAGARGYITKGSPVVALVESVSAAVLGDMPLSSEVKTPMFGHLIDSLASERTARVTGEAAVEALKRSEERFRSLVQNTFEAVAVVDPSGKFVFESDSVSSVLGYPSDSLLGTVSFDLVHPEDVPSAQALFASLLEQDGASNQIELRLLHADGDWRWIDCRATNLLNSPAVEGIVANFRDITERKVLESRLHEQALHDPLTGLANRTLFRNRSEHAIARARRAGTLVGVLFLDVDGFKAVNDGSGHSAGDEVLRTIARRLTQAVRPGDTVGRFGGDEFAVLLEDLDASREVEEIGERILRTLAEPIKIGHTQASISVSIGTATAVAGQADAETLMRNADLSMYAAKEQGKGQQVVFQPAMRLAALERTKLEEDLHKSIERRQLLLQYQPIVELSTGKIEWIEALARWRHPERGVLYPGTFIKIAEESGFVLELGRWVLREACAQAARWGARAEVAANLSVSVNVSGVQLLDPAFADHVSEALEASGLPAQNLVLEITETTMMSEGALSPKRLSALQDLGVLLAIDDFGVGYSSLAYLADLRVDILKIDRTFIAHVGKDEGQALAHAICKLGETLNLRTVGEGVETAEQADLLRSFGCQFAQGFYFSRPASEGELENQLTRGTLGSSMAS